MIKVESSIVVPRPIEEVFAYIGDQTNAPEWQKGLLEVRRTTEGPIGVGTRHSIVRVFLGRRLELDNEYTAYDANSRIAFRGSSGPLPFEATYLFAPAQVGTRVTSTIEMQAVGLFGLAEQLIAGSLRRDVEANLIRLKDVLESRVSQTAA